MTTYRDQTRACVACDADYIWSERDQRFAAERGYFPPKRCPGCRENEKRRRREQRDAL